MWHQYWQHGISRREGRRLSNGGLSNGALLKGGLSVVERRVVEGRVVGFGNPHVKGLETIETQLQCLNRRVCEYI